MTMCLDAVTCDVSRKHSAITITNANILLEMYFLVDKATHGQTEWVITRSNRRTRSNG